jgi:hypothetical protein
VHSAEKKNAEQTAQQLQHLTKDIERLENSSFGEPTQNTSKHDGNCPDAL